MNVRTEGLLRVGVVALAMALLVRLALHYRALFLGNAVDDAYISFRYLDHLLAGQGLVWNPGERVEGYSNLGWILLLAPLRALGWDVVAVAQSVGVGLALLAVVAAVVAASRLFGVRSVWALGFVALVPATSGYFAAWSVAGLETSLHALLLLVGWWRYEEEARDGALRPWSGLVFAALVATRPEGLWVASLVAAAHVARARALGVALGDPRVWRFLVVLAAPIVAYEAWRLSYFGPWLSPTSVRAKVGASLASVLRGVGYVHDRFASPYLLLCAPLGLLGLGPRAPALVTGALLVAFQIALVVGVGGDWAVGRLFAPILPLGAVVLVGAAAELVALAPALAAPMVRAVAGAAAAAWLAYAAWVTGPLGEERFFRGYAAYDAERVRIGLWLREAPPGTRVAVYAAGQIPYYSGLYAHDMLGLNDLHIAAVEVANFGEGVAGHEKSDPAYTLDVIRPDVIVDGHLVPGLAAHPSFARYRELSGFAHSRVFVTDRAANR